MIHVVASITLADASKRDDFLTIFKDNVPNVLAENGCVSYAPVIDVDSGVPAQGAVRDNVVTVIEQWADLDCLHAHLKAPHMATYREKVKDLVAGVVLNVYENA